MDVITDSMDMSLGKLGEILKQSMGLQRVRHDLVTEKLQQHKVESRIPHIFLNSMNDFNVQQDGSTPKRNLVS